MRGMALAVALLTLSAIVVVMSDETDAYWENTEPFAPHHIIYCVSGNTQIAKVYVLHGSSLADTSAYATGLCPHWGLWDGNGYTEYDPHTPVTEDILLSGSTTPFPSDTVTDDDSFLSQILFVGVGAAVIIGAVAVFLRRN